MKFVIVLAFICSVVLAEASVRRTRSTKPEGCKEGESYFDGCNHCVCHDNGPSTCTLKACPENLNGQLPSHPSLQVDPTHKPQ